MRLAKFCKFLATKYQKQAPTIYHHTASLQHLFMRLLLLFVGLFLKTYAVFTQNLVQNPSFEQTKPDAVVVPCEFMSYTGRFTECAETWTTFRDMTPDLLAAAENCPWLPAVHTGNYCAGIIFYLPAIDAGQKGGYREAIQGQLTRPLKPGQRYQFSVWVKEDPALMKEHLKKVYSPQTPILPVRANNLGVYFTVAGLDGRYGLDISYLQGKPQVNFNQVLATKGAWVQLRADFVPDQPFMYFAIGNFMPEMKISTDLSPAQSHKIDSLNTRKSGKFEKIIRAAYICMDDISITPLEGPAQDTQPMTLENRILKERKFTFSAELLFDSGKSDLKPIAKPQLDALVQFLQKYPGKRIGISGHTDSVGSDVYNQELSDRRARAVHQYLLDHGVSAAQINWKGFGKTRPVADNAEESGRQKNRRVECVLLN